jgi:hypothetical protein
MSSCAMGVIFIMYIELENAVCVVKCLVMCVILNRVDLSRVEEDVIF